MLWGILLLLAAGVVAAIALGDQGSMGGLDGATIVAVVASIALLVFIGLPMFSEYRGA